MKLTLMRHAESEYNAKKMINKDSKNKNISPLTEKGMKQAEKSAKQLEHKKFEIIFCSEFLRTQQTAVIVNKFHDVKIKIDKRLNEVFCGFEGESSEKFDLVREKGLDRFNFKIEGKESWNDLKARVGDFLKWLEKQEYKNVLIVSHQWTIGVLKQLIEDTTNENAFKKLLGLGEFIEAEI